MPSDFRIEPFTERWHLDVADGHYVKNLLFFPDLVAQLRRQSAKPFEVHLMVTDPLAWIDRVIDELSSLSSKSSALRLGEDMIATTVCRHAVKANDTLSIPELKALLADLFRCEMPWCCPHGRPTLIQISYPELERKFGRRAP